MFKTSELLPVTAYHLVIFCLTFHFPLDTLTFVLSMRCGRKQSARRGIGAWCAGRKPKHRYLYALSSTSRFLFLPSLRSAV
ncbi:hypothetical protein E2C01_050532 [Portunus trituberculatus]|uniref:Uncharacterized protein n=1 Tax=Portunus trituberculatus TaxID=210409 RepID=A0A5B7GGD9_PORTR|nr:hypothetical protein [Portunus trituberculatus]